MKRIIKFRAKSFGRWVYGDLHLLSSVPHIHTDLTHKDNVKEDTIGMFTGLQDKNGKDVYEDDIIRIKVFENEAISLFENTEIEALDIEECKGKFIKEYIARVKYGCGAFYISDNPDFEFYLDSLCADEIYCNPITQFEVIGNIYDNPELINK